MLKFVTVALRLRYLIPTAAVGGYYSVKKKYDDVKEALPEMPDFVKNLLSTGKDSLGAIDLEGLSETLNGSAQMFNDWLEEASEAIKRRRPGESILSDEARK